MKEGSRSPNFEGGALSEEGVGLIGCDCCGLRGSL